MTPKTPSGLTYADRKKLRRISAGAAGTKQAAGPILFFTIPNGAAHTRAASSIAEAISKFRPDIEAEIIDVSEYMSPLARFTHVTAYLWAVKKVPAIWERIDAFQKRQPHTSPEWFYRRHCRRLFEFVQERKPRAMVATEVGCGEIASLMKRDLQLDVPLVAVDLDHDFDRAWVQPEIDLYCLAVDGQLDAFKKHGVPDEVAKVWGVPINARFIQRVNKSAARSDVTKWLNLPSSEPIVLLAGGGEGLGGLRHVAHALLKNGCQASIVMLAGNNDKLKKTSEDLARQFPNMRVLGWTDRVPELFHAADVLVSKIGTTFEEACACGLPIVALPPLPGAERVKYEFIQRSGLGLAATSPRDAAQTVLRMLQDTGSANRMRRKLLKHFRRGASENIAAWLLERTAE